MQFVKMNGAGNDFIILDALRDEIPLSSAPELARTLCDRRRSIGADGLMIVGPSDRADFRMHFYNADGSAGEMCGNGARCICRYGYEMGYAGQTQTVESPSGLVTGWRTDETQYRIRLVSPSLIRLGLSLNAGGREWLCHYAELGTPGLPHAVVELDDLGVMPEAELFALGKALRWHPAFPKGANVNFIRLLPDGTVQERTFERGVEDFTLACGTGTGSAAAVLTLLGKTDGRDVIFRVPGGTLRAEVRLSGETVTDLYLTGPAKLVCRGEIIEL